MARSDVLTDRLRLRAWLPSDLDQLDVILGDATVMEFSDHGPLTRAAQSAWLTRAQRAQTGPPGIRAITLRSDDCLLGYVSLLGSAARLGPGHLELGVRLSRHA
ncbi:hypothetical protein JANAI62_36820 [Jannaschia pagri]|uniref:N-acetyltransferase domain-containing protein n=1 Tax=Jannaschia pagri TaxID=2829797 RepID=A0ABQ4NRM4_9RHOB|nr:hypothetical protein JANAI61_36320 [Jannaschia sp. AI_61]GIT97059.1 hypothetical protein JANAI62_36820 [Jannaschia sp. AI_62]